MEDGLQTDEAVEFRLVADVPEEGAHELALGERCQV